MSYPPNVMVQMIFAGLDNAESFCRHLMLFIWSENICETVGTKEQEAQGIDSFLHYGSAT